VDHTFHSSGDALWVDNGRDDISFACWVLDAMDPVARKSVVKHLLPWIWLAHDIISDFSVPFGYAETVSSVSSKAIKFSKLVKERRKQWLVQYSWDC
jgi:hypothetical protein